MRLSLLQVTVERDTNKPLTTYFGGVSLRWNKWVKINDNRENLLWNGRSEVVERLLAPKCALCGATDNIEVHHIRKLADIQPKGGKQRPEWMLKMSHVNVRL